MAMSVKNTNGDVVLDINTTPLIDVMLVLLTFLIITLPMQTHAVRIDLAQPGPPHPPPPAVMLEVDFDGSIVWNGWRIDNKTLDARLAAAARQNPQPEIHLMSSKLAKYGAVAEVMADVQRHGLVKIELIDTTPY